MRSVDELVRADRSLERRYRRSPDDELIEDVSDLCSEVDLKLDEIRGRENMRRLARILEKWKDRYELCLVQDVYLRIERIDNYSPVDPDPNHTYTYRRDCFRRAGHENGTITEDEAQLRALTAVVYRPYTDATYATVDPTPLVATDLAEPPVERRVPGVVVYTKPGRRLRIHVMNSDRDPHSLHMHGIQYGIDSDGAYPLGVTNDEGVRSDQICPGESYTYVYDVTDEMTGAWVFHDHHRKIGENARLGLIGGLVVRDRHWPDADHEVPFFMHKVAGRRSEPLFDSGDIAPGADYERTFDTPGTVDYECFYHPMFGTVTVESGGLPAASVNVLDNSFDPPTVTIAPGGTVTWTNQGQATHTVFEAGSSTSTTSYAVNGRSFAGNSPVIEVESGQRIRWYVFNLDFDMEWHNFHPHASHWEFGGQHLDNRTIGPAEAFVVDTVAPPVLLPPCKPKHSKGRKRTVDVAATYPVHCHVEPHVMAGMIGLLRVKQTVRATKAYFDDLGFPPPLDTGSFECPSPDPHHCVDGVDDGTWAVLPAAPEFAVHGAVLRTGKVLIWSGHAELGPGFGLETALFDPATATYDTVPFSDDDDLFCAGHAFLPDGRLVAGGGANQGQVKSIHIFDPLAESWTRLAGGDLRDFRWYPTMVPMADGRIAIVSGTAGIGGVVEDVEVLDLSKPPPATGQDVHYWDLVAGSAKAFSGLYPGLHWLPSGDMFFTRTGWNSHQNLGAETARFSFTAPTSGTWTDSASMEFPDRKEGASVLIVDDRGAAPEALIVVAGGRSTTDSAISDCERITIAADGTTTGWAATANMTHARIGISAVVLPNGNVMVVGGRQTPNRFDTNPIYVFEGEIYDPDTDAWAVTPQMSFPRQYHSVALLLPDGRVFTSGGVDATLGPGAAGNQKTAEAYSPEYLAAANRPSITGAPATAPFNTTITVQTPQGADIDAVTLVAPGAITHHTDSQQRLVKLAIQGQTGNSIDVRTPTTADAAPPGIYMLFVLSGGIPSTAEFIQVTA